MRVTVIVGLIGAGKTEVAKAGARADFDTVWHDGEWDCPERFAEDIMIWDGAVFDGWWTWDFRWWENTNDITLGILAKRADVHLIYMKMTESQAWDAYMAKYPHSSWKAPLLDKDAYKASIPARIEYMERKVMEWGQ